MAEVKNYSTDDLEKLIEKLPDIMSCRVVEDNLGEIQEIHVLAGISRNTKQLVRDIQSAINAEYKFNVDYKLISIAQVEEKLVFKNKRIKIDSINAMNINNMIEAKVVLCDDYGNQFEGKSAKVKSRHNRLRAVADATLNAVENYMGDRGMFYLDNVEMFTTCGKNIVCCIVGYTKNDTEDTLIGTSLSKTDDNEATAKAVLDAVNRRITLIS